MKALLFWLTIDRGGQRASRGWRRGRRRAKQLARRGSCFFQMAVTRLHQPTKSSTKTLQKVIKKSFSSFCHRRQRGVCQHQRHYNLVKAIIEFWLYQTLLWLIKKFQLQDFVPYFLQFVGGTHLQGLKIGKKNICMLDLNFFTSARRKQGVDSKAIKFGRFRKEERKRKTIYQDPLLYYAYTHIYFCWLRNS